MSSDKAPGKLYRIDHGSYHPIQYMEGIGPLPGIEAITYIREDLVDKKIEQVKDACADAYIDKLDKLENEQRRRELFEKMALDYISKSDNFEAAFVRDMCEAVIIESDKFARGEE